MCKFPSSLQQCKKQFLARGPVQKKCFTLAALHEEHCLEKATGNGQRALPRR